MKFIKKHSIAIFFILLTILVFILRFIPKKSSPVLVSQSEIISQDLPSGWQIVDDTAVSLKVEKQVDSGYIPLITLIKSSSPDISQPKNYL